MLWRKKEGIHKVTHPPTTSGTDEPGRRLLFPFSFIMTWFVQDILELARQMVFLAFSNLNLRVHFPFVTVLLYIYIELGHVFRLGTG